MVQALNDAIGHVDESEMHGARFVTLEELAELPLFPPFAEAVESFVQMVTGDMISLTADGNIATIKVSENRTDGGPGSGRYPKGSGKEGSKNSRIKKKKVESLPMTAKEKVKVTHDINNVYHAKYKGKRVCAIRTRSNEPDSPAFYYRFRNHGFDNYDIFMKIEED